MDVNITGYCEDSLTSRSTVEQCFILTFYGLSELSRKKIADESTLVIINPAAQTAYSQWQ